MYVDPGTLALIGIYIIVFVAMILTERYVNGRNSDRR